MRTSKPIATISFNSPDFLEKVCQELQEKKVISFWSFITHKPEEDEGGKKFHNHLYLEPSKLLQTDDLKLFFMEFDPDNPKKPKCVISWVISKFDHWYLYALHDSGYLASKGQSRIFSYSHDDIKTSDNDDLLARSRMIDLVGLSPYRSMMDAIRNGLTFPEYFRRGTVPLNQVHSMEKAWQLLVSTSTERNGREGHE